MEFWVDNKSIDMVILQGAQITIVLKSGATQTVECNGFEAAEVVYVQLVEETTHSKARGEA